MHKISGIPKLKPETANNRLRDYLSSLTPHSLERQLKLRFGLNTLPTLSPELLRAAIMFLLRTRFPLLLKLEGEKHSIGEFDRQLKQLYHAQLKQQKLKSQFAFQFFILLVVKLCLAFVHTHFKQIIFGKEQEQELYCLLIKAIIGLSVYPHCYQLIEQRYIDKEKYQQRDTVTNAPHLTIQTSEQCSPTKKVTVNAIEARLQKRKFKVLKADRTSIKVTELNSTIQRFKQDLHQFLNVKSPQARPKERYTALESLVQMQKENNKSSTCQKMGKKIIHTEQISASLKMNLMLEKQQHCYTRRDFVLRHSNPSSRLTHRIYQTQNNSRRESKSKEKEDNKGKEEKSCEKQNKSKEMELPSVEERNSLCSQTSTQNISKQTQTYWHKLKRQLREFNSSLEC